MSANPRPKQVFGDPILFLAFGGGAGLAPHGPGTWGTLVALPVAALLLADPLVYALVTVLVCLVGIPICGQAARKLGVHDHGGIVWDEIAGMLIAASPLLQLPAPNLVTGLGLAFVLFRFFDIAKPWPIKRIDQKVHGGLGIMLDDILAGFAAAGLLVLCLRLLPA